MLALVILGLLAAATSAPVAAKAPGKSSPAVQLSFTASDPSGIRVYRVEHAGGVGTVEYWINGTRSFDYAPWHIQLIQDDGAVFPFYRNIGLTADGDMAQWGEGDGVVYAGAAHASAESPDVKGWSDELHIAWRDSIPSTAGWLVVAWANQPGPLSFDLHWRKGTSLSPVATGTAAAFEMKDFQEGARVGLPAATVAHAGDELTFEPGSSQLWGYAFIYKSTAFGAGRFAIDRSGDGLHREMSFNATPSDCICFEMHRWAFTSASDLTAHLDLIADGRRTAVFLVVATLPPGTLPADVWAEFNDTPS